MLQRVAPRPVIEIANLRVAFAARIALAGVSLSIVPGEVVVLLGPNGAGKSTLIKTMSGRITPTSGSVSIGGRDPARHADARRSLGIVPQHIALFERLSAIENLYAFARLMGVPARSVADAASAALARVGLAARARDRVCDLSGGMRRRINIAAALMHAPRILVLDEPTAGLDYKSQASLITLVRELKASGLAILLSTHDMGEAEALADRMIVLVAGRIRAEGTLSQLMDDAFGKRRELSLRLSTAALLRGGTRVTEALTAAGLHATGDGRTWAGLVEAREQSFEELISAALGTSGVIEDVQVGRPGLDALLKRLVDARPSS